MVFLITTTSVVAKLAFPPNNEQPEDILDGLLALYQWFKEHAHFAGFFFRKIRESLPDFLGNCIHELAEPP